MTLKTMCILALFLLAVLLGSSYASSLALAGATLPTTTQEATSVPRANPPAPLGPPSPDPPQPESDFWSPWAFTGRDHVDLKWDLEGSYQHYKVMRDGELIATYPPSTTWHRDKGLIPGEVHTYQMCAYNDGGPDFCGYEQEVRVGNIAGIVYRDLSWNAGVYTVTQSVYVTSSACLFIGSGATVASAAAGNIYLDDTGLGAIIVNGGNVGVNMKFASPSSSFQGTLNNALLELNNSSDIKGCTFLTSSVSVGSPATPAPRVHLAGNEWQDSSIWGSYQSWLDVSGNHFDDSSVHLAGEAGALIEDNTFSGTWQGDGPIRATTTGSVDIHNNRIRNVTCSGAAIGLGANTPATVSGNQIMGVPGNYRQGKGIQVAGEGPPAAVTVEKNLIANWEYGVYLAAPANVSAQYNTVIDNDDGIFARSDPQAVVQNNCIGGNGMAPNEGGLVTFSRTVTMTADMNWWGADSGPTHSGNPGGGGDRILEYDSGWNPAPGLVDYTPWLNEGDCGTTDLSVYAWEAVQVVQDRSNSVPLVAGKTTIVRVYPDSSVGTVHGVQARLAGYRQGHLLGTLSPEAAITAIPVSDINALRARRDGGFLFKLPLAWITGTVDLVITVDPANAFKEINEENNTVTGTLALAVTRQPRLAYVPIRYQPADGGAVSMPDVWDIVDVHSFLTVLYPHDWIDVEFYPPFPWYMQMGGAPEEVEIRRGTILLKVLTFLLMETNHSRPTEERADQVVGIFATGAISLGQSDPRWYIDPDTRRPGTGLASYSMPIRSMVAHEIAHNLGLRHPNTRDACKAWDYETYWTRFYRDATVQEYGYNAESDVLIPKSNYDLMSYCPYFWISPLHYRMLFEANGFPQPPRAAAEERYLVAWGQVDTDGAVDFFPFWQLTSTVPLENPPEGSDYCLELRDAGASVLGSRCFDLSFFNYEYQVAVDTDVFMVSLPLLTSTAQVVLRQGSTDLGQVPVSANPPTVTLLYPNGGEVLSGTVAIEWAAADSDGDPLAYNLYYRASDAGSWLPLAINLTGTNVFTLELALLPGGPNSRIRVEASDGFHTAGDLSDGPFTVPDGAPLVSIRYPAGGARITLPITLQGYGYDLEDGLLEDAALTWSSDQDGMLGTGSALYLESLSPGRHTLTLTATDSQGQTSSAAVEVTTGYYSVYLPLSIRGG